MVKVGCRMGRFCFETTYGAAGLFCGGVSIQAAIVIILKMFLRICRIRRLMKSITDCFLYIFIIFVSIVMKSDHRTIIFVDPEVYHRTPQIASDIFGWQSLITRGRFKHKRKILHEKNNRI